MSFSNASHFSTHESTFDDTASDQRIYANHYPHPLSERPWPLDHKPGSSSKLPQRHSNADNSAIQRSHRDHRRHTIYSSPWMPIWPSSAAVSRAPSVSGICGMHSEFLESTKVWPASWLEAVQRRMGDCNSALCIFYDHIENYRGGLYRVLAYWHAVEEDHRLPPLEDERSEQHVGVAMNY